MKPPVAGRKATATRRCKTDCICRSNHSTAAVTPTRPSPRACRIAGGNTGAARKTSGAGAANQKGHSALVRFSLKSLPIDNFSVLRTSAKPAASGHLGKRRRRARRCPPVQPHRFQPPGVFPKPAVPRCPQIHFFVNRKRFRRKKPPKTAFATPQRSCQRIGAESGPKGSLPFGPVEGVGEPRGDLPGGDKGTVR